jgi:PadR family transcriptional regulator AphA
MPQPSRTSPLTTTSYAILGLLAVKPWTTYELAQQMRKALGQFWPRAESKLYEEPKKLVAHGLARAASEMVGERPRTVYSITPKGRRAMAAWVPTPGAGPVLEFEALIKVFYAEHGSKDDLLAHVGAAAAVDAARRLARTRRPILG